MSSATDTTGTGGRASMPGGEDLGAGEDAARPDAAGDAILLRRVQRGDLEAYGELVRRHSRRAYSIAYGVLLHRHDAEDVVQDAFTRAFQRIEDVDISRPFHPWLYRIVMNVAISFRRARSVRSTSELPDQLGSADDGPERLAERAHLRTQLLRALDRLPEQQRQIVLLADLEELSSSEIGEILQMPAGTVRYHLHRARHTLREVLTAADEEAR
jgi:RNA polymerase sigma-70 factor, ECF subfamily